MKFEDVTGVDESLIDVSKNSINTEVLDFDTDDLSTKSLLIKYDGKTYVLKQASADAMRRYRNFMINTGKEDPSRRVQGSGSADGDTLLLSMCLFTEKGQQVSLETIRSWPERVVDKIGSRLIEITGLEDNLKKLKEERTRLDERIRLLEEANKEGN